MIGDTRTVFVVGAGASIPYGFPSANRMLEQFQQDMLDEGHELREILHRRLGGDFFDLMTVVKQLPKSLDELLFYKPKWADELRIAIAYYLLHAEANANDGPVITYDPTDDEYRGGKRNPLREDNWLGYLFDRLTSPEVNTSGGINCAFVTFNYDRLIEHYFTTKAEYLHEDGGKFQCVPFLEQIKIHHVHGSLGPLPLRPVETVVPFGWGGRIDETKVEKSAGYITTAHEDDEHLSEAILAARKELSSANQIVFLGFAYHEFALRRLDWMNTIVRDDVRVYGTALGLDEGVRSWAQRQSGWRFMQLLRATDDPYTNQPRCTLKDMRCEELLRYFNLLYPPTLLN